MLIIVLNIIEVINEKNILDINLCIFGIYFLDVEKVVNKLNK